jgi:hypothetical protein
MGEIVFPGDGEDEAIHHGANAGAIRLVLDDRCRIVSGINNRLGGDHLRAGRGADEKTG